jgi:5-methylcytosine-specific restriction enzyme B
MNTDSATQVSQSYWFVGAMWGDADDQTSRFVTEGIWENGYENRYINLVKAMQPGDRIAIKSSYTRKHDLPFNNRGQTVSVMAIKAIGTVTENLGDGRTVRVNWTRLDTPREWYFYTILTTVWWVQPGEWRRDGLIRFTFEDIPQDLSRFCNAPDYKERFGEITNDKRRFNWTRFYMAVADKLRKFRFDRGPLVSGIHQIAGHVEGLSNLTDDYVDGNSGPLRDICPFTTMGIFNRGITDANRKIIATELAKLLGVEEAVPDSFEGIPVLNNQRSWFFGKENKRLPQDIESLWAVFEAAFLLADSDNPDARVAFGKTFDNATNIFGVGWNLTMGLYWIRPWTFPTLDSQSQLYITNKLDIEIGRNGPKGRCNAHDYLAVMHTLELRFQEEVYPVHSFPELSIASAQFKSSQISTLVDEDEIASEGVGDAESEISVATIQIEPYSIDNIFKDGCFLERSLVETMLECLRKKKNLILQGPPGTGKTWIAKSLAYALIGQRDESKVRAVQFHTNLSYEDFVRGWRPSGDGKLSLVDGPFMEMIRIAAKDPAPYVIVIEEINRGNPAQIFGEMLTLLEADKRGPDAKLELCYRREEGEKVYIPGNLYVIGTMNIADRSLALVDFALRRRFAFVELEPTLGTIWRSWVNKKCGIDMDVLIGIEKRIQVLNDEIAADSNLGRQFRIGHSYVTPQFSEPIANPLQWFKDVVQTEIGPLLDEYWYDSLDKANKARKQLIEGM